MFFILSLLAIITVPAWGASSDLCDILDLDNCSGVTKQGRRSSLLSLPSPATSAVMNPATVSFDRGLGIETIYQPGNTPLFNLASGSGRVGGALISTSLENTFFGNRVFELDSDFLERSEDKKQFDSKKFSIALGAKLYNKKHIALDAGVILKRHSEIKRINPGIGLSGRLGPITLGASIYQDDFYVDFVGKNDPQIGVPYELIYGMKDYSERFTVTTYSMGTKFLGFALDAGVIKTRYKVEDQNTEIKLFSGSYIYKNFMFNLAQRSEDSPTPKYEDGALVYEDKKSAMFGGVQYSVGKHLIIGVNYNYFLLDEFSLLATVYF